jgi:hypothetical protein
MVMGEMTFCDLMKTLRYLLSILLIGATLQLFGQSTESDTTFIFKNTALPHRHMIFIDYNKDSEFYDILLKFKFSQFDSETYKYSTEYLKENNLILNKKKPVIPWTNWVILKQYNSAYYVYKPSDFFFHFRQSVNDTTFIDWTGEGPEANKILEQKKIDDKTYEFKLTGITHQERTLIIHIIDLQNGIAVFEQTTNATDKRYYLMIAAERIKNVPIIVNYCPTLKQTEIGFDKPDYNELLKTK